MKRKKEKALSPIVASILLIAVALALAGILWQTSSLWLQSTSNAIKKETTSYAGSCTKLNLGVINCSYSANNGLSFIIENKSDNVINGIKLFVIDSNEKIIKTELNKVILPGELSIIKTKDLNNSNDFINLVQPLKMIRVIPMECPHRVFELKEC